MKSIALSQFWKLYFKLPKEIRLRAAKAYRLWLKYPEAPGLQFKRVSKRRLLYSARVTDSYRVLGLEEDGTIYWFWIGSHDEYERIIKSMS